MCNFKYLFMQYDTAQTDEEKLEILKKIKEKSFPNLKFDAV